MLFEMYPVKCLKICLTFGMQKPMHFSAWFFFILCYSFSIQARRIIKQHFLVLLMKHRPLNSEECTYQYCASSFLLDIKYPKVLLLVFYFIVIVMLQYIYYLYCVNVMVILMFIKLTKAGRTVLCQVFIYILYIEKHKLNFFVIFHLSGFYRFPFRNHFLVKVSVQKMVINYLVVTEVVNVISVIVKMYYNSY